MDLDRVVEKNFTRNELKQVLYCVNDLVLNQEKFYEAELETLTKQLYFLGTAKGDQQNKYLIVNSFKSAYDEFCLANETNFLSLVKSIDQASSQHLDPIQKNRVEIMLNNIFTH